MILPVVNYHNHNNDIYIFCREESKLRILVNRNYHHYYYKRNLHGEYLSYCNHRLCKIIGDRKYNLPDLYENDVPLNKKFILDKNIIFNDTVPKVFFIDIEVLGNEVIDDNYVTKAPNPISCITLYNSEYKVFKQWYLGDYNEENLMLKQFVSYIVTERPDIITGWNFVDFDYKYLLGRIPDFHKLIGFNNLDRGYPGKMLPLGISVVDYMGMYKKVYTKSNSDSLDGVLFEVFGKGKTNSEVDFGTLNTQIKDRNLEDVEGLVKLEEKYQLFDYYNVIRKLTLTEWEDLPAKIQYTDSGRVFNSNNSKIIDMFLLKTAKDLNIILPDKKDNIKEDYEGAMRFVTKTGRFFNVTQYDLSGAYPQAIIDFCLDSANISNEGLLINDIKIKQNPKALLPTTTSKILAYKNQYKSIGGNTYDAVKRICNSIYGVLGNRYFRLYDVRIAKTTTFLIRDLLSYVVTKLKEDNIDVIYCDTDGLILNSSENKIDLVNCYITQWAEEKYNKKVNIHFDYEGCYTRLFIQALCRYKGDIVKDGKSKSVVKGSEIIRRDSSVFMSNFLQQLLSKILDNVSKEQVDKFIIEKKDEIKHEPIENISFKCKMTKTQYKNTPIFIRALNNTKKILPDFNRNFGESYYYIYVLAENKEDNVLAFTKEVKDHIINIDWDKMIDRNINNKIEPIYESMGWLKA